MVVFVDVLWNETGRNRKGHTYYYGRDRKHFFNTLGQDERDRNNAYYLKITEGVGIVHHADVVGRE